MLTSHFSHFFLRFLSSWDHTHINSEVSPPPNSIRRYLRIFGSGVYPYGGNSSNIVSIFQEWIYVFWDLKLVLFKNTNYIYKITKAQGLVKCPCKPRGLEAEISY